MTSPVWNKASPTFHFLFLSIAQELLDGHSGRLCRWYMWPAFARVQDIEADASCGSLDSCSTIVEVLCEIPYRHKYICSICLNDRILKFPIRCAKISTSCPSPFVTCCEFWGCALRWISRSCKTFTVAYCTSRRALEALFNLRGCHFCRHLPGGFSLSLALVCYPRYPSSLKSHFLWSIRFFLFRVVVARVSLV